MAFSCDMLGPARQNPGRHLALASLSPATESAGAGLAPCRLLALPGQRSKAAPSHSRGWSMVWTAHHCTPPSVSSR